MKLKIIFNIKTCYFFFLLFSFLLFFFLFGLAYFQGVSGAQPDSTIVLSLSESGDESNVEQDQSTVDGQFYAESVAIDAIRTATARPAIRFASLLWTGALVATVLIQPHRTKMMIMIRCVHQPVAFFPIFFTIAQSAGICRSWFHDDRAENSCFPRLPSTRPSLFLVHSLQMIGWAQNGRASFTNRFSFTLLRSAA